MSEFVDDLKELSSLVAEEFRNLVVGTDYDRKFREMRQEAQFVAEVYHKLRSKGYLSESLFMEYEFPKSVKVDEKFKKVKPDLIYEKSGNDEVVEFGVFWDEDLFADSSQPVASAQDKVQKYFTKLLSYRDLRPDHNISTLTLVFAYLGPSRLRNGSVFDLGAFSDSVKLHLKRDIEDRGPEDMPTNVIVC